MNLNEIQIILEKKFDSVTIEQEGDVTRGVINNKQSFAFRLDPESNKPSSEMIVNRILLALEKAQNDTI